MKTGVDHQCHSKPFTGRLLWGALLAITSYQAKLGARQTSTNGWRSLSEVCFCHRVFAELSLVLYHDTTLLFTWCSHPPFALYGPQSSSE